MDRQTCFNWICEHMNAHLLRPETLAVLSGCTRFCAHHLRGVRASVHEALILICELRSATESIRDLRVRFRNCILFWPPKERFERFKQLWMIVCERFQCYSLQDRSEFIHIRFCSYYYKVVEVTQLTFYIALDDPREPSPGPSYCWRNGEWLRDESDTALFYQISTQLSQLGIEFFF